MSNTWEAHVTPAMRADAERQTAKMIAAGFTPESAAAEAAAWVKMKAQRVAMIARLASVN